MQRDGRQHKSYDSSIRVLIWTSTTGLWPVSPTQESPLQVDDKGLGFRVHDATLNFESQGQCGRPPSHASHHLSFTHLGDAAP